MMVSRTHQATLHVLLLIGAFVIVVPMLWMVTTALKSPGEVHLPPYLIPTSFEWANFSKTFEADAFGRFYLNSGLMTGGIVAGQVLFSSMAGYAFARLRFPGRGLLFGLVLATMMMPVYVTLVPSYLIVRTLGWIDSYAGLIVPRLVSPFGIFLMRQYYLSLDPEFEEAALIDGASRLRVWSKIALPMSGPALAAVGIFAFLFSWNDLLWPLIITTDPDLRTVQLGLAMFTGRYGTQWTLLAAGSLVATLPALVAFLVGQRWLIKGISLGSTR